MIFNCFKISEFFSNIFTLKYTLNYKMLFHWSKFNRGLKTKKLTFTPGKIDMDTLGKRI